MKRTCKILTLKRCPVEITGITHESVSYKAVFVITEGLENKFITFFFKKSSPDSEHTFNGIQNIICCGELLLAIIHNVTSSSDINSKFHCKH